LKRPTNLVKRGNVYYYRRQERNKDLWTSLRTGSYEKAKALLDQINLKLVMADAGFGEAPRIGRRMPSVADVLAFYSKADFPAKTGRNAKVKH
jgi:hypothetical protein